MHRVVVLVLEGVEPMDVAIPAQVFAEVPGEYLVTLCGAEPGDVRGANGLTHRVGEGIEALEAADTIVIPGWGAAGAADPPGRVIGALLSAHERGVRLAALSTGVFALARTGLLDGRRVTTRWRDAPALAERFPSVRVEDNVLFVDDGQVLTSAGAASALDFSLHLVRKDHGVAVSTDVARALVAAPYRTAGQRQYLPRSVPEPLGDRFAGTREWALAHLAGHLTLEDMADQAGVSSRTFSRRFADDTGYTPMKWVLRARVDMARELLEHTDLGMERIAERVGLGTGANLRLHFQRILGTSPTEYRHMFSG